MGQVGIGDFLQAKIHEAFTVAADRLAQSGELSVEERIALSGLIGYLLSDFRLSVDEFGLDINREIEVPLTLEQVELPDQVEDLPDPELEGDLFTERIVKGGGSCSKSQWALLSKKTGKTLGCHDTKGDAEDQETAIHIRKRSSKMRTSKRRQEQLILSSTPALDFANELALQGKTKEQIRSALVTRGFDIGPADIEEILSIVNILGEAYARKYEFSTSTLTKARNVITNAEADLGSLSFGEKIDLLLDNLTPDEGVVNVDDANRLLAMLDVREQALTGKTIVDLVMNGMDLDKVEGFLSPVPGFEPIPVRSVRLEPPSDIARQTAANVLTRSGPRDMRTTAVERWSANTSANDDDLISAIRELGFKVLPSRPPIRIKAPIRIDDRSLRSFLMDSIPWLNDIQLIVLDSKRRNNPRGEVSMTSARDMINAVMAGRSPRRVLQTAFEQEVDLTGQKTDDPEKQADKIADRAEELLAGGNGVGDTMQMVQDEFPEVDNDTIKAGVQQAVKDITDEADDVVDDDPGREELKRRLTANRRRKSRRLASRRRSRR